MLKKEQKSSFEKIFTKKGTASVLAVSPETIDRLRKSGALKSFKVGGQVRFKESEILSFIEASSCQ